MTLEDNSTIFDDLNKLSQKLTSENKTYFNYLILPIYLKLINSELTKKPIQSGIKYHIIKLLHYILFKIELTKKFKKDCILIFATETNHLHQIVPVTNLLKEKYNILFISNKNLILKNSLLNDYKKFHLYLPSISKASNKDKYEFELALKDALGTSASKNIINTSTNAIVDVYCNNINYTKKLERYWNKIFKKLRPKAVIIGYDIPAEARVLAENSNRRNVPTIMIQHGAIAKVDGIFGSHMSNTILVFGDIAKQTLIDSGCKSDIKITGAPYLDTFINNHKRNYKPSNEQLKILVAFSGPGHLTSENHHKESIALLVKAAKIHKNKIAFYFKLHPKDNSSYYEEFKANKSFNNIYFSLPDNNPSNNIFDWIEFCDMVFTGASTVAIEAMLLEKPTISIDLTGDYKDLAFNKIGAVKYVTSENELNDIISEVTKNNFDSFTQTMIKANEYKYKLLGHTDGNSATRCKDTIDEIVLKYTKHRNIRKQQP